VTTYRTVSTPGDRGRLAGEGCAAVVLASGSAARAYAEARGSHVAQGPAVVCIGPVTADEARGAGLTVAAVAEAPTDQGILEAVARALGAAGPAGP
jgi:uroporphyrinogen-III synthase